MIMQWIEDEFRVSVERKRGRVGRVETSTKREKEDDKKDDEAEKDVAIEVIDVRG